VPPKGELSTIYRGDRLNSVPDIRIRKSNDAPVNHNGDFVLYWMIAYRRATWNFSLQRAAEWAFELNKPLVVMEALRCGYGWANDRLHRFILEGMAHNARQFKGSEVSYYPYVEPIQDAGKGLLPALAKKACVVITDDFPAFFLPRMVASASRKLGVLMEQVDSNGLLPMLSMAGIPTLIAVSSGSWAALTGRGALKGPSLVRSDT